MFGVVSYDISDDERRLRVQRTLEGYGVRVQRSVFECDLSEPRWQELRERLVRLTAESDSVRCYLLCGVCVRRVDVIRGPAVFEAPRYWVV